MLANFNNHKVGLYGSRRYGAHPSSIGCLIRVCGKADVSKQFPAGFLYFFGLCQHMIAKLMSILPFTYAKVPVHYPSL